VVLWYGNVFLAPQEIDEIQFDVDNQDAYPEQQLSKAIADFGGCIRANSAWIPNYGERYRLFEAISNALVESVVNRVVSKRMVNKQQMCWTYGGAHLLLLVRTRVLNDDLAADFQHWYPAFVAPTQSADSELAA
jgi:hypothetical protein